MVFASCLPLDYYWIYCRRLRTHSWSEGLGLSNLNLKKIIFDIWNSSKDINELKTLFRCQARQFLDKEIVLKSEIPLVDLSCIFLILDLLHRWSNLHVFQNDCPPYSNIKSWTFWSSLGVLHTLTAEKIKCLLGSGSLHLQQLQLLSFTVREMEKCNCSLVIFKARQGCR